MSVAPCNSTNDLAAVRHDSASFARLPLRPFRSEGLNVLQVVSAVAVRPACSSYQLHTLQAYTLDKQPITCVLDTIHYRILANGSGGYLVWPLCIYCRMTCQLRFKHSIFQVWERVISGSLLHRVQSLEELAPNEPTLSNAGFGHHRLSTMS